MTLFNLFMSAYEEEVEIPWKIYGAKTKRLLCSDYSLSGYGFLDGMKVIAWKKLICKKLTYWIIYVDDNFYGLKEEEIKIINDFLDDSYKKYKMIFETNYRINCDGYMTVNIFFHDDDFGSQNVIVFMSHITDKFKSYIDVNETIKYNFLI